MSRTTANLTRAETAARSAAFGLRAIGVELDLRSAPDLATTGFPTTTTLEFDARNSTRETWIDFIGERVLSVTVNGESRDVDYDGARIRLTGLSTRNTVVVAAIGAYSRSGEGLHRFTDPVDGETYLYTQYEPADARRVMACFEQPDLKARYTFTVHAPAAWSVLSNQHPVSTTSDEATQTVVFAPTLPISSYITAVAAGPYARVDGVWTREKRTVELGVLCRASLAGSLDAEEILTVTKQGLDFFTERFDFPYPWGKYDQIFVPEYNLGAMENPGLVTFTEEYLFRGASTRAQHEARATVILHEMAHMWFGDLVTMKWWDDLWLKESFADYMGAWACVAATEFTDAWVTFANRRKGWAYLQDQLPTTHPIVADIPDLEAAKLNFDGITYAKGAAVLKQLSVYVGVDAFTMAARRYFRKHAFGNTTLADLLAELESASGRNMREWSRAWLETSGVSTLRLGELSGEDRELLQSHPRPHRLEIGSYRDSGPGELELEERLELDVTGERTLINVPNAPLVLLNDSDLTYAKVRLDERSVSTMSVSLDRLGNPLTRGVVWSALWNATRDGELAAGAYLDIAARFAPGESNSGLADSAAANAGYAATHYVPDSERAGACSRWLAAAWDAAWNAAEGSDSRITWLRASAQAAQRCDARAADILALLAAERPDLPLLERDEDLRWAFLTAVVATGHAGESEIAAQAARDSTATGVTSAIRARAAMPTEEAKADAWRAAWEDLSLSNDHLDAVIAGFRAGERRELIDRYDGDYFTRIREAWGARSIEIASRLVEGLFPEPPDLGQVDAWLADQADAPGALRRLVLEQRDRLARALAVRAGGTY